MSRVLFPLRKDKSPAVPKETDWRKYSGEVDSPMVGVGIPTGVIVLDIDTYKGVDTDDVEKALGCSIDWEAAELQKTLSGGHHYAFSVPIDSNMISGANLLGVDGFDTRAAGKGYIATGEGYEDLTLFGVIDTLHERDALPPLPEEAVERLSAGRKRDEDDSDLMGIIESQPLEITDEEVELYMSKLTEEQAADHETWLKVMFALHHQTQGSEFGWELFDQFSRKSMEHYDERKNRRRWESCEKGYDGERAKFGSVIKLVGGRGVIVADQMDALREKIESVEPDDKVGFNEIVKEVAATKLDELNLTIVIKSLMRQSEVVFGEKLTAAQMRRILKSNRPNKGSDFYEDYIFLTGTGEYMDRDTKATMGPRSFDVLHSRDTPPDEEGNTQSATGFVNNRIECVHAGMYAPMFDDVFMYDSVPYFNTYKPNVIKRVQQGTTDIVERVKGHIAHLLIHEDEQQIVINYLAHNVQYPGKKIPWSPILQGVQGDGKSFLAEMMKFVLGQSNCETMNVEQLEEKFTPWAEGNCMVFIEELKLDNYRKYETLNKLKPYITNPTVTVRRMRTDAYECINTTNYFALTNFKDALPIDDNDRRYCVLFSQWQSKQKLTEWMEANPDYYPSLYEDMRANPGEIIDWLMSHDIPDSFKAMSRAPETRAKSTMVDMAKSDDFLLVEDAIIENECDDINDFVVNVTKLAKQASDCFSDPNKEFPKTKRLRQILLDMGYHPVGRYKDHERKNQLVYCKDDSKSAIDFKPEMDI